MKNKEEKSDEEYLNQEFPKGKTKFRGQAMVLLALARKQGKSELINQWKSDIADAFDSGKAEAFCKTCGFPKEWERNPIFIKNDVFSIISLEEDVEEMRCPECKHWKNGSTIKKIELLLRKYKEVGKSEAQIKFDKFIIRLKEEINKFGIHKSGVHRGFICNIIDELAEEFKDEN